MPEVGEEFNLRPDAEVFVFGDGGHNGKRGGAILLDSPRRLCRDAT